MSSIADGEGVVVGTVPAGDSASPVASPVPPVAPVDAVTARLAEMKIPPDLIKKIKDSGVSEVEDFAFLTDAGLKEIGVPPVTRKKLLTTFVVSAVVAPGTAVDPNAELPEDTAPSEAQVQSFAGQLGMDSTTLLLYMSGNAGADMDFSGMIPIANMVNGYNPKLRNMYLMIMGQVERRLGVPVIVIDSDGSVNRPLTTEYIEGLEEGREAAENNIYFDSNGTPHEVIRVGVDAQSIYDADPLDPSKALQKNGMGIGRINWKPVSLEVRQVAYYAVVQTKEIEPGNDGHLAWMRDHMKAGANRLVFHGQAPRAIAAFNEAARTGSLPTLRVMLSRSPRKQQIFPSRRRTSPRDLTGIGGTLRDGSRSDDL